MSCRRAEGWGQTGTEQPTVTGYTCFNLIKSEAQYKWFIYNSKIKTEPLLARIPSSPFLTKSLQKCLICSPPWVISISLLFFTNPYISPNGFPVNSSNNNIRFSGLEIFFSCSRCWGFLDWGELLSAKWTVEWSISIEGSLSPHYQTLQVTLVQRAGVWPPNRMR